MYILLLCILIIFTFYNLVTFKNISDLSHYVYDATKHKIIGPKNEIIDNLWIGDHYSSIDKDFFKENNIKTVINCTKNLDFIDLHVNKYRLPINDDRSDESNKGMIEYFNKYYNIIDNELSKGNGVLVHCHAGCQRSATLIALYLMKKNNINFNEAKKIIRSKRFFAFFPSVNFKPIFENLDI